MKPPLSRIESLESFFAGRLLPEALQVDAATTQHNPRKYVDENLKMLKDGSLVDIIAWCRLEHMEKIRSVVEVKGKAPEIG